MNNRLLAFLAAFGATTIYGLNHTIAKVVMPFYIGPFGFIMLRVIGAGILFGQLAFSFQKKKLKKRLLRILGQPFWVCVLICSCFLKDYNCQRQLIAEL